MIQFVPVIFMFLTTIVVGKELPSFLHVCHKNDPDINQCIIKAVYELKPHLANGVPEMNIPSLEPLILNDLVDDKAAGIHMTVSEVEAYGCTDFTIDYLNFEKDTHRTEFNLTLPHLRIDATYKIDGKILMIPVKGEGHFHANITDCTSNSVLTTEYYEKNGVKHFRYIDNHIDAKIKNARVHLDSFFKGDAVINEALNEAINKNVKGFMKELAPVIEKGLQDKFLQIANHIVEDYSVDELMPE